MTTTIPRILILEDEERFSKLFEYSLQRAGYNTEIIDSYNKLDINYVNEFNPDIIIVDAFGFGKRKFEIAEMLRDEFPVKPVIIISSLNSISDCKRSYSIGATHFLHKSSDLSILMDTIKNMSDLALHPI